MGKYFSVKELTKSDTAEAKKINNIPNETQTKNLENLIVLLDIIREELGMPIKVNSGFRSKELNAVLPGASKTSWHMQGMAADLCCSDNMKLWNTITSLLEKGRIQFTELINEKPDSKGNPTWVHIALNPSNLKNQIKLIK